jgi:hypothetical protein
MNPTKLLKVLTPTDLNTTVENDFPPVLWLNDTFDADHLTSILHDYQPKYIVSDHFSYIDILDKKIYTAPLFLAKILNFLVPNINQNQIFQTRHTFNFVINKKQINRFLCMKFVQLFKLSNYDYTWSGADSRFNMTDIITELDQLQLQGNELLSADEKSHILSDIQIPAKFFYGEDSIMTTDRVTAYWSTLVWLWENGLNEIYSSSVVSLICESVWNQKAAIFTEKTAFAVLGKTFPIWVGGYKQAHYFENMGFDVFHDLIDHSYQYYDTLIERCYYAFKKNLRLLSDHDYAANMRDTHIVRLEHNRQLIASQQISEFCKQTIKQWPIDLQEATHNECENWFDKFWWKDLYKHPNTDL